MWFVLRLVGGRGGGRGCPGSTEAGGVSGGVRALQRPLRDPPEELASLWRRHGVAAAEQRGHREGPLGAGGLDPHTTVDPHQQLAGDQLLQVRADLTVGGQQPVGDGLPEYRARGGCSHAPGAYLPGAYLLTNPRETVINRPPSPNIPIPLARPEPSIHASSGSMSLLATMK